MIQVNRRLQKARDWSTIYPSSRRESERVFRFVPKLYPIEVPSTQIHHQHSCTHQGSSSVDLSNWDNNQHTNDDAMGGRADGFTWHLSIHQQNVSHHEPDGSCTKCFQARIIFYLDIETGLEAIKSEIRSIRNNRWNITCRFFVSVFSLLSSNHRGRRQLRYMYEITKILKLETQRNIAIRSNIKWRRSVLLDRASASACCSG